MRSFLLSQEVADLKRKAQAQQQQQLVTQRAARDRNFDEEPCTVTTERNGLVKRPVARRSTQPAQQAAMPTV